MGCRCCKMIQSYIFDPEEVQSPRYINEVNNYKSDKQDSSKFKGHKNSETTVPKNDLQDDELKRTENKNRLNSTKEALWDNRRGSALHEEGLGNCVEKSDDAINCVYSCSATYPIPNPNTNRIEETTMLGNSSQSASSSLANSTRDLYTNGLFQPNESGKESDPEGDYKKPDSEEPESSLDENSRSEGENLSLTESAILETQNNATQLPELDYLHGNGSQTRNSNSLEKDSFPDNYTHSKQNAESIVINKDHGLSLPLHMKENYDSLDKALKTEFVNVCVKEDMPDGIASTGLIREEQEAKYITHKEINGKMEEEEEDAEVAEALAALEAATAGEDYDEDNEY